MGIHKFHTWIRDQYPKCLNKVVGNYRCDHIYIDANHILHMSLHKATTKKKFITHVINSIAYILRIFRATKSVTVALDGVAPHAKIEEQKKRRQIFKDIDMDELNFMYLTPGTQFMKEVGEFIQKYLENRAKSRKFTKIKYNVIPSEIPGEGEIKLIRYMKNNNQRSQNDSHLLVGNDADLIVIAASHHINNIFVGIYQGGNFTIDMDLMLNLHFKKYGDLFQEVYREDFALVSLLLGNDYLKNLYGTKVNTLWEAYEHTMVKLRTPICSQGVINKDVLKVFLRCLVSTAGGKYKHTTVRSFDPQRCRCYWEGIVWCMYMYQTGRCARQEWSYSYKIGISAVELLMTLQMYPDNIPNKTIKSNTKPIDTEMYPLLILPKKARQLIKDKYQKIIDKELSFMYEEEDCETCYKLRTSSSTLHGIQHRLRKEDKDTDEIKLELSKLGKQMAKHKLTHPDNFSVIEVVNTIKKLVK